MLNERESAFDKEVDKVVQQRRSVRHAMLQQTRQLLGLMRGNIQMAEAYFRHRIALDYLYQPRPDDIFVVSYPKSGTTLIQMMLYQMTTDGSMDFPHIDSVSPWFENFLHFGLEKFVEESPSPRIFKSHLRYRYMPRGVRSIYIARDLRDVVVSAFHHDRLVGGYDLDLVSFAESMLSGRTMFGSWFKHIESWWPHRNDPNVLFLRYEEVIADLAGAMRQVETFCNLPLDEATAARVLDRCSLPFMKQYTAKFDPRLRQFEATAPEFIRKGVAGDGCGALSPDQEERVVQRLADLARRLGCALDEPHHEIFFGNRVPTSTATGSRDGVSTSADGMSKSRDVVSPPLPAVHPPRGEEAPSRREPE